MAKTKISEAELIEEAVSNLREDRELTYELLSELRADITTSKSTHRDSGIIVSKYMETLQRSNEQMVKIIAIIKKDKPDSGPLSLSDKEADELFDIIKG